MQIFIYEVFISSLCASLFNFDYLIDKHHLVMRGRWKKELIYNTGNCSGIHVTRSCVTVLHTD
jgi:hypothetical protein